MTSEPLPLPAPRPMFYGTRVQALEALYKLGASICQYSYTPEGEQPRWAKRCDCKYGIGRNEHWPTLLTEQTGCPELRSLYNVIYVMSDAQWTEFTQRADDPAVQLGPVATARAQEILDRQKIKAKLAQLTNEGPNGVPVLGASVALAHTEQVYTYKREAAAELTDVWRAVLDDAPYDQLVSVLTGYQLTAERWAGLR